MDGKFRGKDKISGLWRHGSLIIRGNTTFIEVYFPNTENRTWQMFEVIPETVGQYISKDKFDNDIYVGSEVKLHDYSRLCCDAQHGRVVCDEEEAMYRIEAGTNSFVPLVPREVEVIDNPELKGEKE